MRGELAEWAVVVQVLELVLNHDAVENIVRAAGLQLKVRVHTVTPDATSDAEITADLDRRDQEILLEHGAEVLKAIGGGRRIPRCRFGYRGKGGYRP